MKTNIFQIRSIFTRAKALRHKGARFALMLITLTAFLLIGCNDDPNHQDTGFIPVGEWTGPDDWGDPDKYSITKDTVTYVDPYNFNNFKGTIITAVDFKDNAGVIIIKILNDPVPDSYTPKKFTCVYYKDYTSSNVKLTSPIDEEFKYIEADNLNEAKKIFTVDNAIEQFYGTYTQ